MDRLVAWLLYSLPWWLQVAILALVVGVPVYLVVAMIWGRSAANRLFLPLIALLAAIGVTSRARQQGYNDRRAEEEKALDYAEEVVGDKRDEIRNLPDKDLHERVDKWTRR